MDKLLAIGWYAVAAAAKGINAASKFETSEAVISRL
jgi:hypothetical protein